MAFEIAPLRALRFDAASGDASALAAPPYDIIGVDEHRRLLDRSPRNVVRLTLGEQPGAREPYERRAARLQAWKAEGILRADAAPAFFAYGCEYTVPGSDRRSRFLGLLALGSLHAFEERVVLPHEHTFPKVVDDRLQLLEATRTHLESIFLLFEDALRKVDALLAEASRREPLVRVEARPREHHSLWRIDGRSELAALSSLLRGQRPIIADGHHRYTTALKYRDRHPGDASARWLPMVLANLHGEGLSILATHRLVKCRGRTAAALEVLRSRLETVSGDDWDYLVETRETSQRLRVPEALRRTRQGAAASDYAILHQVVLGEWLAGICGPAGAEASIEYFKEGSGEKEALDRGDGDLLFRMRPVSPGELRAVVDGGEVFPHKTTFFYPKLWSGLVLWALDDSPAARASPAR
jgi:uncharacterized protein (DUF1015 family)